MATSSAIPQSAVSRVLGIQTIFKNLKKGINFLPQRIIVVGQGNTAKTFSTDKVQVTSANTAGTLFGFGSPIHLAVSQLLPKNGDGVGTIPVTVYPLYDAPGSVPSLGTITVTGTATASGTFIAKAGGIAVSVAVALGDTAADIGLLIETAFFAEISAPVLVNEIGAGVVEFGSKWKGANTNSIIIEISGPTDIGVTFAIVQPINGATNPDVDDALDQIGDVWESLVLNCMEIADTASLEKYRLFGEGRWGATVRKPLVVFTGNTAATVANAIAVPDARKTDRVNAQLVAPGSTDLPLIVAARELARIAVMANSNPAHDYGSQVADGLTPGTDGEQWLYVDREQAVLGGSSTIQVKDSVINLSDTVTFYHPTGDTDPAYRFVVDIIKAQQVLFNLALRFEIAEWDGAPLIPDNQATTNPTAKKPKMAVSEIAFVIDGLANEAIISDPDTAKASISANISEVNGKRLDATFTVQLAGNSNIKSIDFNFGFYYGSAQVVA